MRGDLAEFGVPGIGLDVPTDDAGSRELAELAGLDRIDDPIDHGILVPLALGLSSPAVIGIALEEGEGPPPGLASALSKFAGKRNVAVVASANGSIGLSPRAPLTEVEGQVDSEEALIASLEDVGTLAEAASRLTGCARAPLTLLGQLFGGRKGTLLAHEAPVGVGYLVALVS